MKRYLPWILIPLVFLIACDGKPKPAKPTAPAEEPVSGMFIESQNEKTKRFAVLESNGTSVFIYITDPGIKKPKGDAFVFSEVPPAEKFDIEAVRKGSPPVISKDMASPSAFLASPQEADFKILWSEDGNSVAALYRAEPRAMIVNGQRPGYSKAIAKSCMLGEPFDETLYSRTFKGAEE